MMALNMWQKITGLGVNMEYLTEIRLSRAFAVEFDKFWQENPKLIPSELLKTYILLKQEYENQISIEIQ